MPGASLTEDGAGESEKWRPLGVVRPVEWAHQLYAGTG
jgi:hypothetical protein